MKKLSVGLAVLAYLLIPQTAIAQDADEEPETVVVTTMTTHVPIGEERQQFLEFIERVIAPQARNNPNILAFHVLRHYYGSNSSDVVLVRVYSNLAGIEAECGEPCRTWADENLPEEGEEGFEELEEAWKVYSKYSRKHADEIYISNTSHSKMPSM